MTLLELVQQTGVNPKWVAGTGGGEYHSACPDCGGTDRFYIQPNRQMSKCLGSYCCRQCGIYGDSIQFAQKFFNCSFKEAAEKVNAIISDYDSGMLKKQKTSKPESLKAPPALWVQQATDFAQRAHQKLLKKHPMLKYLKFRGLPLDAVVRHKLGWLDKDEFLPRSTWGLPEELSQDDKPKKLWLPAGVVIPFVEQSGSVMRLKIRRTEWHPKDKLPKYVAISGSMNGLSIIGSSAHTTVVVVESELDAYALHYIIGDFACVIAIGSNIKNPDILADSIAKKAKKLLICRDNDDAGKKMFAKWKKLYSHAKDYPTPIGKDIGEAIEHQFDMREWILKG